MDIFIPALDASVLLALSPKGSTLKRSPCKVTENNVNPIKFQLKEGEGQRMMEQETLFLFFQSANSDS